MEVEQKVETMVSYDTSGRSDILGHFHPSAWRHFERAHMMAGELDPAMCKQDDEQSSKQERCKQWVLNECGCLPRDLASWEGSVRYESGASARLDSFSGLGYSGMLDSVKSNHPLFFHGLKAPQNLESWTSARSPTFTPANAKHQEKTTTLTDVNGIEAPRSSVGTEHGYGDNHVQDTPADNSSKSR